MNLKTVGLISVLIVLVLLAAKILAGVKAERIKVNVNSTCVEKIADAATSVDGVISTNWNHQEKELEIVFEEDKISLKQIEQAISEAGFSTPRYTAPAEVAEKLPQECRIRNAITFNVTSMN